jgi:hypothetical protein
MPHPQRLGGPLSEPIALTVNFASPVADGACFGAGVRSDAGSG